MTIKQWEIYWAKVRFEDSPEVKTRPVVIINANIVAIVCLKITSQNRGDEPPEYSIREWQKAGLDKESYIRHDKFIRLRESDLGEKIGRLNEIDQLLLQHRLKR